MTTKAVTSENIKLKRVRLAFANLHEAKPFGATLKPDEIPKRRATLLLDPSNAEHAAAIEKIKEQAKAIATKYWDGNVPKSLEKCYGNGNDLDKVYDGFKDMFYIRVSNKDPFPVVGRRRTGPKDPKTGQPTFVPVKPGDPEDPLNGHYINATVSMWTQDSHGRKAINGNILAAQFCEKGPVFGRASADADDEFDELPDTGGASEGAGDPDPLFD